MLIDGLDVDLSGLSLVPGLVNAHDHLDFALFPKLGRRTYANASEWATDIYRPEESPIQEHLRVPKDIRLLWGGLRNLIAGVTLVCHHNPWHPVFDNGFPIRVLKRFGWAHSLAFSADLRERVATADRTLPFFVHLGEGTDRSSAEEIFELHRMGGLDQHTVLIHAVGLDDAGWELVRKSGAAVVWCPRSNLFTLGRTLDPRQPAARGVPFALGTDSPLTAEGDLLDEMASACAQQEWTGSSALRVLRAVPDDRDFIAVREHGAPPDLVVVGGSVQLISERLMRKNALDGWSRLHIEGRQPVFVRVDVPTLIARTRDALGSGTFRLAGREVYSCPS
jgi:cytosine/adenosine deaminase-related metal-dependent hydrolase